MKKLLIVFFYFIVFGVYSQCEDSKIQYNNYPGLCVQNAIKWLNMSRSDWVVEMNKYKFSDNGIGDDGGKYFSTGNNHTNIGVQLVLEKDFNGLGIHNMPINDFKKSVHDEILNQLEPYFAYKEKNTNYFIFKYTDGIRYKFGVSLSNNFDFLFLSKIK